jgi:hypothetical protein
VKPIEAHPEATEEFHEAVKYYERKREGLGVEFRGEISGAIQRLREQPQSYPIYEDTECREVEVWRFPFVVYFVDEPDRIWVIAFANQYRRPGYWRKRLRDR